MNKFRQAFILVGFSLAFCTPLLAGDVKQVQVEAKVVEVNNNFQQDLGANFGVHNHHDVRNLRQVTRGPGIGDLRGLDNVTTLPGVANSSAFGDGIGTTQINDAIRALETQSLAEVLSAPRVTTLNNQEAQINQGENLRLNVTPNVTPDDRITMDVQVNDDAVINAPVIQTPRVTTTVSVPDGGTVLLGGIPRTQTSDNEDRIPYLGDIPIVGPFFFAERDASQRNRLLVFVSPQILQLQDE